jgi:hypothetical protein
VIVTVISLPLITAPADSGAVLIRHCAESGQHGYQWWASDGGVFHIGAQGHHQTNASSHTNDTSDAPPIAIDNHSECHKNLVMSNYNTFNQ